MMNLQLSSYPWLTVCDSLELALWLIDGRTLQVLYANDAAVQLVGRPPSEMVGQSVLELAATPEDVIFWSQAPIDIARGIGSYSGVVDAASGALVPVLRRVQAVDDPANGSLLLLSMRDCAHEQASERESELLLSQLQATLDCAADGVLSSDLRGEIRAFNRRLVQMWQLPEALVLRRDDGAILAHMQAQVLDPAAYSARLDAIAAEPLLETRDILRLRDGSTFERHSVAQLIQGRAAGRVFSFRDITEQVQAQAELRLAAQAFESSLDAMFIAGGDHRLVRVNPSFERLLALASTSALGRTATALLGLEQDAAAFMDRVLKDWDSNGFWEGELRLQRADASHCVVHLSWVVLRDDAGAITQSIGFMQDKTQQHAAQERIAELAYNDALTGLPNRLQLGQRVKSVIDGGSGQEGQFALLFLDLDRFKIINDSMGHLFGDRVLQLVAQRLQEGMRHSDMLSRIGGDEFVLYLHGADEVVAGAVAQRMLDAMGRPFVLDELSFSIQCSIGVALYPRDGRVLDDLIKHADTAMYSVKDRGRGSYGFYEPQMNADLLPRMKMEHALRQALRQGHMAVHYQPQVDMASGAIVGAEALLRWNDPQLGAVSPGRFIPLAEESGYIVTLGAWVMEQAVAQAAAWRAAGAPLSVSVNVSALEFRQPGFVARVQESLERHDLPASLLELELTESILLQDAREMAALLQALSRLGVRLAIDDFGTGYSSLAYLKKLAIHRLKIDKSFVDGLPGDEGSRAIVQAITSMGRALRIEVLAEGVETETQRQALQAMDCGFYQGFLCAPALPADGFRVLASCLAGAQ